MKNDIIKIIMSLCYNKHDAQKYNYNRKIITDYCTIIDPACMQWHTKSDSGFQ